MTESGAYRLYRVTQQQPNGYWAEASGYTRDRDAAARVLLSLRTRYPDVLARLEQSEWHPVPDEAKR